MTHTNLFGIMTSSIMSMASNETSFNSVFDSASNGTYHVTLTSIFRLLPVSTLTDKTSSQKKTKKLRLPVPFLSKFNKSYVIWRGLTSWSFFVDIFLYLSSLNLEINVKNHNSEFHISSLWFLAIFSTLRLDRYRNIFLKNNELIKPRLLRGHSKGFRKIQLFNPLPQLYIIIHKSEFFFKKRVEL